MDWYKMVYPREMGTKWLILIYFKQFQMNDIQFI
jgi:hypothetical protein